MFVNRMLTLVRGGGETFDFEIARALSGKGCVIHFLSSRPLLRGVLLPLELEEFGGEAKSFTLASPFFGWFPWDKVRGGWRLRAWEYRCFERKAIRWVMDHATDYDVIQICELPYVVSELKRQGCPAPIVMRLTAPNYGDDWGGVQKADRIIASGMTIPKLREQARPDAVDIPNSVDTRIFRPHLTGFRELHGIGELDFVLLYVARFQAFKDHETLIRAFNVVAQRKTGCRLILAGSGHMEGRIRELCKGFKLGNRVLFLGETPYQELPEIYAASDMAVISSTFESFCFAAIEAMATELPIVTTDNGWVPILLGKEAKRQDEVGELDDPKGGGCSRGWKTMFGRGRMLSEVLEDIVDKPRECIGNKESSFERADGGLIVPVKDPGALAEAILWLSSKRDMRGRMGKRNRMVVEMEYAWEKNAGKLLDVYEGVVREHNEKQGNNI